MFSIRRAAVAIAALAFSAAPALAQATKPVQPDQVKDLRAKLELLRAQQAEIEAHLKKLGVETELKRVLEFADGKAKLAQIEFEKALDLKVGQERLARVKEEIEKAVKLKDGQLKIEIVDKLLPYIEGQENPKVVVLQGGKPQVPYEQMSPQQLKELIVKLTQILEEKTRNTDKTKPGTGDKPKPATGDKPKPGAVDKLKTFGEKVKPGGIANDELMRRLEKLTFEIEELKRAIKK